MSDSLFIATVAHKTVPMTRPVAVVSRKEPTDAQIKRRFAHVAKASELEVVSVVNVSSLYAGGDEESRKSLEAFAASVLQRG